MYGLVATEMNTIGICPHNCGYCYIPKSDAMKEIHADIVEYLKDGRYIELLKEVYGGELEHLSLWGTEPTLTLPLVADLMPAFLATFPKLITVSFSTAMMNDPAVIVDFIRRLAAVKGDRKLSLGIQISIDGPAWITDSNRMEGAAALIPKNFLEIVRRINKDNLNGLEVAFRWKVTHGIENMRDLIDKPNLVHEFVGFFEVIYWQFRELNKNKSVSLTPGGYIPTMVVPGKYTSEDGRTFAAYLRTLRAAGFKMIYLERFKDLFRAERDLDNRRQFSCSGGDANLGTSLGKIHICHRTFYLDDERYIKSVLDSQSSVGEVENWDVSLFRRGTIDFIRDKYIVPPSDIVRFLYVLRGYHDFWRNQIGYARAVLCELARAGQVDELYIGEEPATLFALFLSSALSCPMENLLNTGSTHLQTLSLFRMFGNGAFQEILKELAEEMPA